MAKKRSSAKEVAVQRDGGFWIDHAVIVEEDIVWLKDATELTLWNVTVPSNFFSQLAHLRSLDVRGGSAHRLDLKGAHSLEHLAVNQVRGLCDLSEVSSLETLRSLSLYGLAQLAELPSFAKMKALKNIEIGQMKILVSIAPLLEAPNLRELLLIRKISVSSSDVRIIQHHPTLEKFDWFAEDVPVRVWKPVLDAVGLFERNKRSVSSSEENSGFTGSGELGRG